MHLTRNHGPDLGKNKATLFLNVLVLSTPDFHVSLMNVGPLAYSISNVVYDMDGVKSYLHLQYYPR